MRCAVGCVVDEFGADFEADAATLALLHENNYQMFELPQVQNAAVAEFPHTTPLSIKLASFKVYPEMSDFVSVRFLRTYSDLL